MKLTVLVAVLCLLAKTVAYSQERQTTKYFPAHYNGLSLALVLRDLTKQTGLGFIMDAECKNYTVPVYFNKDSATIEEVLDAIFKNQPVT